MALSLSTVPPRDFVQSLARGMAVIEGFSGQEEMSLAEVADAAGVSRPAARRLLMTLEGLGYVSSHGGHHRLTPRIVTLGRAYLTSLRLVDVAEPLMQQLTDETGESSGLAALDGPEIVYLARVAAQRIMSVVLDSGSRLPAYATSMGRVLLADLPNEELETLLARRPPEQHTERTTIDHDELLQRIAEARRRGWSFVDQELEQGLRSVAAPIRDAGGQVVAAVAASCHAGRVDLEMVRRRFVPAVVRTADGISAGLGFDGRG